MAIPLHVIILLCLLPATFAKYLAGSISLDSDNTEKFLTKFSFSAANTGLLEAAFNGHGDRFEHAGGRLHKLTLGLFDDVAWEKYQGKVKAGSLCEERMAVATVTKRLTASAPRTAEYSLEEKFSSRSHSHFFYFVLADCSLEFYQAHPPTLDYTFHITNGLNELPEDEAGLLRVNFLASAVLGVWLGLGAMGLKKQIAKYNQVHLSTAAIYLATCLQFVACFCEFLHLACYKSDGKGMRLRHGRLPMDFFSDTAQNLSEALTIVVVVSVASGWTLVDGTFREMSRVAGVAGGIAGFQFVVELLSRRYEEDFSSFHDHDHWPGKLLMVLRVLCCGATLFGTKRALARVKGDDVATKFLTSFAVCGVVWLLAFPTTVLLITPFFSLYNQHYLVETSAIATQSVALGGLLALFLGVGGVGKVFVKASTLKDMGGLDGGGGDGGGLGLGASPGGSGKIMGAVKRMRKKVAVD